jgi:hypothetical protein
LTFFIEDKLGYLRCLPDAHPEFKDYKVEWEKPWMKDVSKWMNSATATREKTMGTKYSELVFGPWRNIGNEHNQQIEIVRWLLGSNEDNTRVNSECVEEEVENSGDDRGDDGDEMDIVVLVLLLMINLVMMPMTPKAMMFKWTWLCQRKGA